MDYKKLIDGQVYVRDVLNTLPVSGADSCQKILNSIVNINITINELQVLAKQEQIITEKENEKKLGGNKECKQ